MAFLKNVGNTLHKKILKVLKVDIWLEVAILYCTVIAIFSTTCKCWQVDPERCMCADLHQQQKSSSGKSQGKFMERSPYKNLYIYV